MLRTVVCIITTHPTHPLCTRAATQRLRLAACCAEQKTSSNTLPHMFAPCASPDKTSNPPNSAIAERMTHDLRLRAPTALLTATAAASPGRRTPALRWRLSHDAAAILLQQLPTAAAASPHLDSAAHPLLRDNLHPTPAPCAGNFPLIFPSWCVSRIPVQSY